jgi:hypothetical protein
MPDMTDLSSFVATASTFQTSPSVWQPLRQASLRENNENCDSEIAVTPPRERMPWTSDCKASMRS